MCPVKTSSVDGTAKLKVMLTYENFPGCMKRDFLIYSVVSRHERAHTTREVTNPPAVLPVGIACSGWLQKGNGSA